MPHLLQLISRLFSLHLGMKKLLELISHLCSKQVQFFLRLLNLFHLHSRIFNREQDSLEALFEKICRSFSVLSVRQVAQPWGFAFVHGAGGAPRQAQVFTAGRGMQRQECGIPHSCGILHSCHE